MGHPRLAESTHITTRFACVALAALSLAGCQALLGLESPSLGEDAGAGEICDDGVDNDGDGNADCDDPDCGCQPAACGNGVGEAGEACDDGNGSNADDCLVTCVLARCGDGFLDGQGPDIEECDDAGESAACDLDCTAATCGDGTANAAAGEMCDDAGESAACDADCSAASCGDATVNPAAGEQCDDAGESATCDADCTASACGDGTTNPSANEQCDDAGNSSLCDADCTVALCGDAFANPAAGEQCDDGGESAACDADCTARVCGDGTVNTTAGEQCDDAGNSSLCDLDCTVALCGDAFVNPAAGEQCDDGGESATCDADCTAVACGDGTTNPTAGEQCDDGNTTDGDGCAAVCTTEGLAWNVNLFPISIPGITNSFGDLAFDGNGDLLFTTGFSRGVQRVDRLTGAVTPVASGIGGSSANGVAFRQSDGLIYALGDPGQLFTIDAAGAVTSIASLPGTVNAIAVAPPNFGAFADQIIGVNTGGAVLAFDPASGGLTTVATVGGSLSDLVFAADGRLFVASSSGSQILAVNAGGGVTVVVTGLLDCDGVAFDNSTNRLFAAVPGIDQIIEVDPATGATTSLGGADFDDGFFVSGIIHDQLGALIFLTGETSQTLQAIAR